MQVLCPREIKIQREPNLGQKSLTVNSNSVQSKISQSFSKGVRPERQAREFITFIQLHRGTVERKGVCVCVCVCTCIYRLHTQIYCKGLGHVLMEAGTSQDLQGEWAS